jgi:hypothetical protein
VPAYREPGQWLAGGFFQGVQVDGPGEAGTGVDLAIPVKRHRGQTVEASKAPQGKLANFRNFR